LRLHRPPLVPLVILVLLAAAPAIAQRDQEYAFDIVKTAFEKVDIHVEELEILSGGREAEESAALLRGILAQDLRFSGLFRVAGDGGPDAPDSTAVAYAVQGSVEGRLPGTAVSEAEARPVIVLKLVTFPERQHIFTKRYNPGAAQLRASAHHFANQVIETLTGEPGICLTRIVFSRGSGDRRDLFVVDFDGENLLRLTANRTLNLCPSWSPDGAHVAFTSYNQGMQGLYLLETRTGKVRRLLATEGLNLGPGWHPEGQEIIVSLSKDGDPEIYRIDLAGNVLRRLTFSPAIEVSPAWDPFGRDVVFTSDRTGTPQLYIMDADGTGRRRLTFEGRYNDSAVWSPNGSQVVYATREGDHTQLVVISPTGENRDVLTDSRWRSCEDPSWAPDGRHVVFASDRTGVFKLYVMDVVEKTWRRLTYGDEPDITPAWSP
jgi:TolB protein